MRSAFGFPPHFRLRRPRDFQRAYREGSRAKASQLIVVAVPNGLDHPRLGLSVGRRIWRGAVQRNRVRRLFREAFRLSVPELPPGVDLVLIPSQPRLDPDLARLRRELVHLAAKAHRRYLEKQARAASEAEREPS